jgi:hypothetical protein
MLPVENGKKFNCFSFGAGSGWPYFVDFHHNSRFLQNLMIFFMKIHVEVIFFSIFLRRRNLLSNKLSDGFLKR